MAGLFDNISDFFLNLFSNDPNAVKLRKQLRELQETVLSVKPAVYSKSSDEALPGLATSWLQMYSMMLPIFDLLSKTIGSQDAKIQALSLQFLIESSLVGDIAERRLSLTYENIKQRIAGGGPIEQEVTAMTNEFNALIADVKRQNNDTFNREIGALFKLKNLVTHNFQPFFKRFGYDLSLFGKQGPRFTAVSPDEILPDLLDLYFILADMEINPTLEKGLSVLLERVSPQKATENLKKMEKILDRVRDLMRGPCSPYLTLSLIRVLKKDPEFEPDVFRLKDDFINNYVEGLISRFSQDRDRAQREVSESSLESDVRVLFPDGHLLPLSSYNDETNQQLIDAGLPHLSMIKPMQILRSFDYAVLRASYLDHIKQVVLNGFFQDKEWATKLSNSLYACEGIGTRIESYDTGLQAEGKTTLPALEKYFSGKAPVSSVPNQIVEKINRQATELLEAEVGEIATLSARVQEILMDYKSPQPKNITNIKGLGGKNHREVIQGLVDGYNKSMQLFRIMKHFVVIKGVNLQR